QNNEPPSSSSSTRLGTMRVVWMCSGFSPRAFFCFRRCLIQPDNSATESHPTQSLMRCKAITCSVVQIVHRAPGGNEGAEPIPLGSDRESLRAIAEVPSTGSVLDLAQHRYGFLRAPPDSGLHSINRAL